MSDTNPAIEVKGVSKCYTINHKNKASYSTLKDDIANLVRRPFGKQSGSSEEQFWALEDINFEVPRGEIFGVIGKNGSGKSTLLKILSRIVDPTKGSIHIRGRVASLLEVGTGFHPELTGRENIYFNGSMLGMGRHEIGRKFQEIVDFSEIEKFIDTPVKFYSSGMYVRLAFAVAAHLDPEILILDEVLAVGDASFQQKSMKKILKTMQEGRTVLFVSHSMGSVRQLCTNGILLNSGKVEAAGNIGSIIDKYMLESMNDQLTDTKLRPTWHRANPIDNEYFIPEALSLVDDNDKVITGKIRKDEDYWVKIEGEVRTTDENFAVGYAVWDKDSKYLIYMCMTTDGQKNEWPKLKKGPMNFLGKLPKNLLNEDKYKITAIATLHYKFWIFDAEASPARIEIDVKGGTSRSPIWVENRGGIVAPLIEWRS